jgi:hypothetical protein
MSDPRTPTYAEAVSTLSNYGDHHEHCEKADRQMPQWETARCTCGYDRQLFRIAHATDCRCGATTQEEHDPTALRALSDG